MSEVSQNARSAGPGGLSGPVGRLPGSVRSAAVLVGALATCGALYAGRAVLVPIALATLFAFVLSPAVDRLERAGLNGAVAISGVAFTLFAVLAAAGWVVIREGFDLIEQLPEYRDNIALKIEQVRLVEQSALSDRVQAAFDQLIDQIDRRVGARPTGEEEPIAVEVRGSNSLLDQAPRVLHVLAQFSLVVLLVILLLFRRRELRDRLLSLCGDRQLTLTTKALDEAAERISRYLVLQCLINGSFGIAVGCTAAACGLRYALLWGFLAAVLRFVPFVGPWIAAALPAALSLAAFPGWGRPLLLIGILVGLELVTSTAIEPLFIARSTGTSDVGLVVAVAFWTWLWGPVGLLLSTPLTVCLVVVARYVPRLAFIGTLLGDEEPIPAPLGYYQRLLAKDFEEAWRIVQESRKGAGDPEQTFDRILMPALERIGHDRHRDEITDDDVDFVLHATGRIRERLAGVSAAPAPPAETGGALPRVIGCAWDVTDGLALEMLRQLLGDNRCEFVVLGSDVLLSEMVAEVQERAPKVVVVAACQPGELTQGRYYVKRLRASFAKLRIVVLRFGSAPELDPAEVEALKGDGADEVVRTLLEARRHILELVRLEPAD